MISLLVIVIIFIALVIVTIEFTSDIKSKNGFFLAGSLIVVALILSRCTAIL